MLSHLETEFQGINYLGEMRSTCATLFLMVRENLSAAGLERVQAICELTQTEIFTCGGIFRDTDRCWESRVGRIHDHRRVPRITRLVRFCVVKYGAGRARVLLRARGVPSGFPFAPIGTVKATSLHFEYLILYK